MKIKPIILCGGSGTRLWPESRKSFPKQFLPLIKNKSLLDLTLNRLKYFKKILEPTILTSNSYKFYVLEALKRNNLKGNLILEPEARGTTAAIYIAAKFSSPKDQLLIMPSDHLIENNALFYQNISDAYKLKNNNEWVIFGIKPHFPSTGYGYINLNTNKFTKNKLYKVFGFEEKPNLKTAKSFLNKNFFWNSGIFMGNTSMIIDSIKTYAPQVTKKCDNVIEKSKSNFSKSEISFDKKLFLKIPSISIDYSVMEKANNILCQILDSKWNDIGSWDNLEKIKGTKKLSKKIVQINSKNNFVRNKNRMIATIGIEDTIIIDSNDSTLIAKKGSSEKVKEIVEKLEVNNISEAYENDYEFKPWGKFENLLDSKECKVKKLFINPQKRLSLQYHKYRSEHWLIVSGKAKVYIDNETLFLNVGESIDIPQGSKHYIENLDKSPLIIIETQLGSYFGEDDIIRLDDPYERN